MGICLEHIRERLGKVLCEEKTNQLDGWKLKGERREWVRPRR